jgi:hypothetical protein
MTFSAVLAWLLGGISLTGCFAVGYFVLATRKIAAAAERAVPPVGTFIDIDGDRIHYVETGEVGRSSSCMGWADNCIISATRCFTGSDPATD